MPGTYCCTWWVDPSVCLQAARAKANIATVEEPSFGENLLKIRLAALPLLHAHSHVLEYQGRLLRASCALQPAAEILRRITAGTGPSRGRFNALAGTGWSMVPTQNAWKRPQPAASEQDDKAAEADAGEQDRIDEWGIEALQSAEAAGGWANPQPQDLDDEWPMPGGDNTGSAAGASDSPWDAPPSADSHWDEPPSKAAGPSKPMVSSWGAPKAAESASEDGEGNSALLSIFWLCSGGSGCLTSVEEHGFAHGIQRAPVCLQAAVMKCLLCSQLLIILMACCARGVLTCVATV